MKKLTAMLACALLVFVAGCAQKAPQEPAVIPEAMAVFKTDAEGNKQVIRIGDTRAQVEAITGPDQELTVEFQEDNVERTSYWDAPGLAVDYNADDVVVALRITEGDWHLENGLAIGKEKKAAETYYAAGLYHKNKAYNGVYVAFDENFAQISYRDDAPYLLQIDADDNNKINMITLQKN